MKDKAPVIVLIIVVIGLGVALLVVNDKARDEKDQADGRIKTLSNDWKSVSETLGEQQTANRTLQTNLVTVNADFSNKLAARDAQMATMQADLAKTQADAKAQSDASTAELAQRDKKIADLESQNQELDKTSTDLRGSITNLETQINATRQKLANSEGDRASLIQELKALQARKDDLERKFNDLASLREQVHKLKDDMAVARRLDWMRRGVYDSFKQKGGERLMHNGDHPTVMADTNSSLNVDLYRHGGSKIQAPVPSRSD